MSALVVQWIEWEIPNFQIGVRFPSEVLYLFVHFLFVRPSVTVVVADGLSSLYLYGLVGPEVAYGAGACDGVPEHGA